MTSLCPTIASAIFFFKLVNFLYFCIYVLLLNPKLFHHDLCHIVRTTQQPSFTLINGLPVLNFVGMHLKDWRIHFNSFSTIFVTIKWQTNERFFQACFSCPILTNKQYPRTLNTNSSISKSTLITKLRSFSSCFYFLGSYKKYKILTPCVRHDPGKCVVLLAMPVFVY